MKIQDALQSLTLAREGALTNGTPVVISAETAFALIRFLNTSHVRWSNAHQARQRRKAADRLKAKAARAAKLAAAQAEADAANQVVQPPAETQITNTTGGTL